MRAGTFELLRCPACGGLLAAVGNVDGAEIVSGAVACMSCPRSFAVEDGIPNLVHPPDLLPSDREFKEKYDAGAEDYDTGLDWLFAVFRKREEDVRERMIDLLDLHPGARVLETGCGTGRDSLHIVRRIAPGGELYAQDLSVGMLRVARRKLAGSPVPVELVLSNASYLPFADAVFDAAFHFGGINTFGEVRRAIDELTRVVASGGRVVFGDEGIAPWLREKLLGRILVNANPLYAHRPPVEQLPPNALDVRLHWILGNAFYLVEYRVGDGPPPVDLDLPIPGPRGGTLRSRYYGK